MPTKAATLATEFGDFQTPPPLAKQVCGLLTRLGVRPAAVVEPTCGAGHFALAALDHFLCIRLLGVDINASYVAELTAAIAVRGAGARCNIRQDNVFGIDWREAFDDLPEPLLILGNPPWVTNARLGGLGSSNLPLKSNFQGHLGLDALTGKSNFDVSEWVITRQLEAAAGRRCWLAMLCKTAVARKVLAHAWKSGLNLDWAEMRLIDANDWFGVSVDACLLVCALSPTGSSRDCAVYSALENDDATGQIGWRDGQLVADAVAYQRRRHLIGHGPHQWRSGVKHDCAKVMELRKEPGGYRNALGELADLEDECVYPMLKSSEVAKGGATPSRWMLVPQVATNQETASLQDRAPKTWDYLQSYGRELDRRGSSIYRNRPRFSVFGVGPYTFTPWKVAISGFYKRLAFAVVGPTAGKPIVFDDTVYFLPCECKPEARFIASLLNSEVTRDFYSAFVFWDAKRPITVELLKRLDLRSLARDQGRESEWPSPTGTLFDDF